MLKQFLAVLFCLTFILTPSTFTRGSTLEVGTATVDITPEKSVPLCGQWGLRLSQGVNRPITANVLALEAVEGQEKNAAIFVSVEVCVLPDILLNAVREKVAKADSTIDVDNIILSATHTHTAPAFSGAKLPSRDDVADYPEIIDFVSARIADAIVQAWQARKPNAEFAWGSDYAGIGFSRREVYKGGSAVMYGDPGQDDFDYFENVENHEIGAVFFRDENKKLCAIMVNVACPSQVNEGDIRIDADYWHYVRESLHQKFGDDVVILGQCSAAGDISPHYQYEKDSQTRARNLRGFEPGLVGEMQEIARKITIAVSSAWEVADKDWQANVPFQHEYKICELPMRIVTEAEMQEAKGQLDAFEAELAANPDKSPAEIAFMGYDWFGSIVNRYNEQQTNPNPLYKTPVHVVRLGDLALCTNEFELFTDFGIWIKTHSPAVKTFIIQLAGPGPYLPTKRAVEGGSYSAVVGSNQASPEGGDRLVRETVDMLREIWK
ncbi:MAG: hypothetical protein Q4G68_07135 [Planctomycetia bacterium]|nr:hypothetical protein [Planctomycetia bacterium]